jgi:hypothetical protein
MGGVLDKFDVAAVVTHPSEPNTVFVATAEGGPFKSVDGGVTWIGLDRFGTMADSVNAIARPPLADNVLAATQGFGIQTCAADGQQCMLANIDGLTNLNVNALAFAPNSTYAATDAGLFHLAASSPRWAATALSSGRVSDIVTDDDGTARRIWATAPGQGVAYSADGGTTFTIHSSGLSSLDLT